MTVFLFIFSFFIYRIFYRSCPSSFFYFIAFFFWTHSMFFKVKIFTTSECQQLHLTFLHQWSVGS